MANEKVKSMSLTSTVMTMEAQAHTQGQISLPKWFCTLHNLGSGSGDHNNQIDCVVGGSTETHQMTSGFEIKAAFGSALYKKAKPGSRLTVELIHPVPLNKIK